MIHMTNGYDPVLVAADRMEDLVNEYGDIDEVGLLHSVAYVTFQELATRVSHRNTGKACNDPIADRMLQRIAADENLHIGLLPQHLRRRHGPSPDQTLRAVTDIVTNFQMPGMACPTSAATAC